MLAIHRRVDVVAMVTNVDRIYVDFATADARGLYEVTAEELRELAAGQIRAGTMGPKVEAALRFIAAGGSELIVVSSPPDRRVRRARDRHARGERATRCPPPSTPASRTPTT